jgi:hypothetical protein
MPGPTHATTLDETIPQFDKDIRDVHLIYDYDARSPEGKPEKWRYEMFVPCLFFVVPPMRPSDLQLPSAGSAFAETYSSNPIYNMNMELTHANTINLGGFSLQPA